MNFIVLSTQRSGSHLLQASICSHPDLHCQGELGLNRQVAAHAILNQIEGLNAIRFSKSGRMCIAYSSSFPLNYLRSLPDGSGYLVQYSQMDVQWRKGEQTWPWNDAPRSNVDLSEFNVIHLVRSNVFEHALSRYINNERASRRSPRGSLKRATKIDRRETFSIEPELLKWIIEKTKQDVEYWRNKLNEDNPRRLTLDYEELYDEQSLTRAWEANEPDVVMPRPATGKICDFLEVNYHELRAPQKRMNTPDYENYIENWDEIKGLREVIELS